MRGAALWGSSTALSALLHTGLAALVLTSFAARPTPQQPAAKAEMTLTTMNVQRSTATEAQATSNPATAGTLSSEGIGAGPIPRSEARASPANVTPAAILGTTGQTVIAPPDASAKLSPAQTVGDRVTQAQKTPATLTSTQPDSTSLESATSNTPDTITAARPDGTQVPRVQPPQTNLQPKADLSVATSSPLAATVDPVIDDDTTAATLVALSPDIVDARREPTSGDSLSPAQTDNRKASAQNATGTETPSQPAESTPATSQNLQSESATTVLAWSGTLTLNIAQDTLETAAALRVPTAGADTEGLRDALANRLSDIDCARVQTVYDPETGAIDLRGHVRNDADRARLMDRVSNELGGALPVNDRLRRLEAPQCSVLVRLAEMPLPQSVEQLTNPLIIGDDLQTRTYTYTSGQSINFDLAGADYDGWLYLDFYDGEGQVLHLIPNEVIDPLILSAETPLPFGDGSENDPSRGKFQMQVTPPFGQDIAVAMVANIPLFDTPRPTVEAAAPYLEILAKRVETLRRTNPDFKGEWVYLFVETRP